MPYTLDVVFTGIVGFVPHADGGGACALIPDALNGQLAGPGTIHPQIPPPRALDGAPLRRHFGILRVPGPAVGLPGVSQVVHYFRRERLTLDFATSGPASGWSLDPAGLIPMTRVSEHHQIDAAALKARPPKEVLAQVVLAGGTLRGIDPGGRWTIPRTLSPHAPSGDFAHEVVWRMSGVEGPVTLAFASLDGGPGHALEVEPVGGGLTVHIANVCADNPLQWTPESEPPLEDDVDFRWHYQLLSPASKAAIVKELAGGRSLPFPVPAGGDLRMPGGGNCMTVLHEAAAYSF